MLTARHTKDSYRYSDVYGTRHRKQEFKGTAYTQKMLAHLASRLSLTDLLYCTIVLISGRTEMLLLAQMARE